MIPDWPFASFWHFTLQTIKEHQKSAPEGRLLRRLRAENFELVWLEENRVRRGSNGAIALSQWVMVFSSGFALLIV